MEMLVDERKQVRALLDPVRRELLPDRFGATEAAGGL
jgi:hypothetical protein